MTRIISQDEAMDTKRYQFMGTCTEDDGKMYEVYDDIIEQETCHSLQPSWLQSHIATINSPTEKWRKYEK